MKIQRFFHWGVKVVSLAPRSQSSSWQFEGANIRKASTYRAAVLREFGTELQIEELKRKKLESNQVSKIYVACKYYLSEIGCYSYCLYSIMVKVCSVVTEGRVVFLFFFFTLYIYSNLQV